MSNDIWIVGSKRTGTQTRRITVCDWPDRHTFDLWVDDESIVRLEYQETLSERGTIRVAEPSAQIYSTLIQSDPVSAFLEQHGFTELTISNPNQQP